MRGFLFPLAAVATMLVLQSGLAIGVVMAPSVAGAVIVLYLLVRRRLTLRAGTRELLDLGAMFGGILVVGVAADAAIRVLPEEYREWAWGALLLLAVVVSALWQRHATPKKRS